MIVLKFGGTSVGSSESITQVKEIVSKKALADKVVVVVSAVGGVTNKLERALRLAADGDVFYAELLKEIEKIHLQLVKDLIPKELQKEVIENLNEITRRLEGVLNGVFLLKEVTPKSKHFVLGMGEMYSSRLIHQYLKGTDFQVQLIDPRKLIICREVLGKISVNQEKSLNNAHELKNELKQVNLCPGFIAASEKGQFVTLGRGGSDYTAALLANYWDADVLEIWSDVDGLMTADPRLVTSARLIPHLSYEEALELSHFGAKVIYPPAIQPVLEKNITIQLKNTFDPEAEGTMITRSWEDTETIRGISSIRGISLLNLSGSGMVGIPSFSHRLFQALSEQKVNVIMITQASSEHTISVGVESADTERAVAAVNLAFESEIHLHRVNPVEVEDDLVIVALVGSNMRNQVGISGQLFSALGRNGINIKAIAQGSSERNISLVIEAKDLKKATNTIHETFFSGDLRKINLFLIGVGNVGSAFLDLVSKQRNFLKKHAHIEMRVVGIANSRKMNFATRGVLNDAWTSFLHQGETFSIDGYLSHMFELNLRNAIFIDMTGSADIAEYYPEILKKSISVVTPNKNAATSPFQHYQTLKFLSRKFKAQFLIETNVCAGLPVISTVSDLVRSGDRIHKIEAVLSGTLNYLFNHYDGQVYFSQIVRQALKEGYTEPDPRLDLSGMDVMRKILILARESGYQMDLEEVEKKSFVPDVCMNHEGEDFFLSLEKEEGHFRQILEDARSQNSRIRYVARFDDGKASCGLEFVNSEHPFFHLEGKDNIVLFFTDRYKEHPLVVKGAGAGATVTASGIFADVMKAANINQ
jgi:aspartokinase/homoserine dehydrogenase 1